MAQPGMTLPFFGGYGPPARFREKAKGIEAQNYDFRAARTFLVHPNNLAESIIHMLMFGLGAAVVAAHEAYYLSGVWSGIGVNLCIALINGYSVCTLIWSAQHLYGRLHMSTLSYPDIAEACVHLSPWPKFRKVSRCFRYTVEATLMIHLYGNCSMILVMIGRNLKQLCEGCKEIVDQGDPPLRVYLLSLMLPCAVIVMITDLKNVAPFALIADVYACAVTFLTMYYGFRYHVRGAFTLPGFKSYTGFFEFVGVCVFTTESVSIALPVENNMEEPKKFPFVVLGTAPTVTASMMIIGFFGYWLYGREAKAPITVHFPFTPWPTTMKVFINLVLWVIYAVCFYVAFDIEWFYLKRNHQVSNYWFWERLYRTIHVIAITFLAYVLPDVTRVMGILGCFVTSPAIFIYPPIIEILVYWEHPGLGRFKWRLIKSIAIIMFGLSIVSAGTYFNVADLIRIMPALNFDLQNTGSENNSLVFLAIVNKTTL